MNVNHYEQSVQTSSSGASWRKQHMCITFSQIAHDADSYRQALIAKCIYRGFWLWPPSLLGKRTDIRRVKRMLGGTVGLLWSCHFLGCCLGKKSDGYFLDLSFRAGSLNRIFGLEEDGMFGVKAVLKCFAFNPLQRSIF
jgi:hypothetical protein